MVEIAGKYGKNAGNITQWKFENVISCIQFHHTRQRSTSLRDRNAGNHHLSIFIGETLLFAAINKKNRAFLYHHPTHHTTNILLGNQN